MTTRASIVGGGLVRTSLKCSAHLASCSASMASSLLCLFTIGVSIDGSAVLADDELSDLVHPCSPLLAASSA